MAEHTNGFSVERFGSPESGAAALNGWAVVHREAGEQRRIVGVYLTDAQAESAAERLGREAAAELS